MVLKKGLNFPLQLSRIQQQKNLFMKSCCCKIYMRTKQQKSVFNSYSSISLWLLETHYRGQKWRCRVACLRIALLEGNITWRKMIIACSVPSEDVSRCMMLIPPRRSARGINPPKARCCLPHPPPAAPSLGSASPSHPPPWMMEKKIRFNQNFVTSLFHLN